MGEVFNADGENGLGSANIYGAVDAQGLYRRLAGFGKKSEAEAFLRGCHFALRKGAGFIINCKSELVFGKKI